MFLEVGHVYLVAYHAEVKRIDPYLVVEARGCGLFGVVRLTDMFETYAYHGDWREGGFPYEMLERLF